ncbi:hypothetical protein GCM10023238_24190 [Streptomyces heliomycini]
MVDVVLMQGFAGFMWLLSVALIVSSGFRADRAATRREDAYRAADKKTKPFWLLVLVPRLRGEPDLQHPVVRRSSD